MKTDLVKIKFFFPKISPDVKNKREFVRLLMEAMRKDGSIKYAGYLEEKGLYDDLLRHIGDGDITQYKPISIKKRLVIKSVVAETIQKCNKILPHPDLPIFVFIYPWLPDDNDDIYFEGIGAFSSYYTMHILIKPDSFTQEALKKSIAHEWNHLVFYRYHTELEYSLSKYLIMEGLAEIFREEVIGGKPAPWVLALTKKEAGKELKRLESKLEMKGMKIYRKVFWGDKEYKRWTGYSIGYLLVSKFRKKNPKLRWEKLIKLQPEVFI